MDVNNMTVDVCLCGNPVDDSPGRLAVAWQHPQTRAIRPVALLGYDGEEYCFRYITNVLSDLDFVPFIGFPELRRRYSSRKLFPFFAQRVLTTRRHDYEAFIRTLDLPREATPWQQLARSEGRRVGDSVILFPEPTVGCGGQTSCTFFVHGIRHVVKVDPTVETRLAALGSGDILRLVPEPKNQYNSRAMLTLTVDGIRLGWVPDLLLDYAHAVYHMDRYCLRVRHVGDVSVSSSLRLLVDLNGHVAPGYVPFGGMQWQPLEESC